MRLLKKYLKVAALGGVFAAATGLALEFRGGGLWEGLSSPAIAANNAAGVRSNTPYDLTQLKVVNEVLKTVRDRYVDPKRVRPKEMLLSALNYVQRDVAQVIVMHEDGAATVKIRVDTQEKEFRVDNVQGPWDVSARLREVFGFVQEGLSGTEVDLREVEYAACNGMLHTLDPHSVLLSPEAYKEMNLSTSGQFGGLGIVISIRDQQLTVMNPMPATPAGRAGIKKYDRILKINNESTLNMGLNEAVNHLRGVPGTKVTVWLHRDGEGGWQGARPFELTREVIRVQSVEHRLLEGGIGYVRLKQFQANTAADLDAALHDMRKNGEFKGLVLDLRGNPGGLLEQAAKVADKFIAEGPIVATVGNPSEGREEKSAHADGTEPNYPIAMLVSGTSASASEIVAGAMKNHDRAVVIGETTFGKGSVQLVFNDLPDKAALKLTIAQYLTEPGDISIQGTGVTPDIQLDPMTVDPFEMDLTVDGNGIKERDLSRSLSNAKAREGQRPLEVLRFNLPQRERQELRERGGDPPDDVLAHDFSIKFARDFLARTHVGKRLEQLRGAKAFINEVRSAELGKFAADLQAIGVDWSDAPADVAALPAPTPPANVEVKFETDRPQNEVVAGEAMQVKVTVTNKGSVPLFRVTGVTKSDNGMFDNKELVFGKVEPGRSKTATVPFGWCEIEGRKVGSTAPLPKDAPRVCHVSRDALTRADGIKIHFDEARNRAPADMDAHVTVKALDRPTFAYSYQIVDNRKGNGDGRAQKGEGYTMYLTVRNAGKGRSYDTQANLRNLSGDGVLLHEGRFDLSNMMPGDTKRGVFTFDIEPQLQDQEVKVELSISDRDLRESVVEKIRMPLVDAAAIVALNGTQHAKASGASLAQSPDVGARIFGKLAAGAAVSVVGSAGEFAKVNVGANRFAFIRSAELEAGGAPPAALAFEDVMAHAPPFVDVTAPVLATGDGHISVKGAAIDDEKILDAYIFVGSRKVFYRSNRNGSDARRMSFDAQLPLRPGTNVVTVVARESQDTMSRKVFVVRKDGPGGELLASPKMDDDLSESGVGDDD
jgi:carboxyl-terminal processing protease